MPNVRRRGSYPRALQWLGRFTCSYCGEAMKKAYEECPTELIHKAADALEGKS
jgi:hypothetical protein